MRPARPTSPAAAASTVRIAWRAPCGSHPSAPTPRAPRPSTARRGERSAPRRAAAPASGGRPTGPACTNTPGRSGPRGAAPGTSGCPQRTAPNGARAPRGRRARRTDRRRAASGARPWAALAAPRPGGQPLDRRAALGEPDAMWHELEPRCFELVGELTDRRPVDEQIDPVEGRQRGNTGPSWARTSSPSTTGSQSTSSSSCRPPGRAPARRPSAGQIGLDGQACRHHSPFTAPFRSSPTGSQLRAAGRLLLALELVGRSVVDHVDLTARTRRPPPCRRCNRAMRRPRDPDRRRHRSVAHLRTPASTVRAPLALPGGRDGRR